MHEDENILKRPENLADSGGVGSVSGGDAASEVIATRRGSGQTVSGVLGRRTAMRPWRMRALKMLGIAALALTVWTLPASSVYAHGYHHHRGYYPRYHHHHGYYPGYYRGYGGFGYGNYVVPGYNTGFATPYLYGYGPTYPNFYGYGYPGYRYGVRWFSGGWR
jgi:hypothetical protein